MPLLMPSCIKSRMTNTLQPNDISRLYVCCSVPLASKSGYESTCSSTFPFSSVQDQLISLPQRSCHTSRTTSGSSSVTYSFKTGTATASCLMLNAWPLTATTCTKSVSSTPVSSTATASVSTRAIPASSQASTAKVHSCS